MSNVRKLFGKNGKKEPMAQPVALPEGMIRLNPSGLDEQEQAAYDALTAFWTAYMALDEQHPDERFELNRAVHEMQKLFALRVARHLCPDFWPTWRRAEGEAVPVTYEETP